MKKKYNCRAVILILALAVSCLLTEPVMAKGETKIIVQVGGTKFNAVLYNNKAAEKLLLKMPFQIKMTELNGNEKYKYLSYTLPEKEQSVGQIRAGDIMLYGDDCLVVFYKSFRTSYQYTKIGRITDPEGLEAAAGKGSVSISFSEKNVSLSKTRLTIRKGQNKKIRLSGAWAKKVKWSSSDEAVARVKGGKVTGRKPGKAVITAKYQGKKYKCRVTVKKAKRRT